MTASGQWWEYLIGQPLRSGRDRSSSRSSREIRLDRGNDPLVTLRRLMTEIYASIRVQPAEYAGRFTDRRSAARRARASVRTSRTSSSASSGRWASQRATSAAICSRPPEVRTARRTARRTRGLKCCCQTSAGWDSTHKQSDRRRPSYPRGNGTRLCRCASNARRFSLQRGQHRSKRAERVGYVGPAQSPLSNDLTPFTPWMARESVEPAVDDSEQQQQQQ